MGTRLETGRGDVLRSGPWACLGAGRHGVGALPTMRESPADSLVTLRDLVSRHPERRDTGRAMSQENVGGMIRSSEANDWREPQALVVTSLSAG